MGGKEKRKNKKRKGATWEDDIAVVVFDCIAATCIARKKMCAQDFEEQLREVASRTYSAPDHDQENGSPALLGHDQENGSPVVCVRLEAECVRNAPDWLASCMSACLAPI
eukprot:1157313-Pelagomonas_calceolata.AAC.4